MASAREFELLRTRERAAAIAGTSLPAAQIAAADVVEPAGAEGGPGGAMHPPGARMPPVGTLMSGMMRHGGLYTLQDATMMSDRLHAMMTSVIAADPDPAGLQRHVQQMAVRAAAIPSFFFYHIVDRPYRLHSALISYLVHPARHLRSPLTAPADDPNENVEGPGKTYDQANPPSIEIPAAFTFVGQFIDHDLTLNAMNLFDMQSGSNVASEASPLIDLDSVYGPRVDDANPGRFREIPITNGYFNLRAIHADGAIVGYDVCREDKVMDGVPTKAALIGDKRNDENQIILQVHILLMRLHNALMDRYHDQFATWKMRFDKAREQTILHWQAFVLHQYLPRICAADAIGNVIARLEDPQARDKQLVHRPGRTISGGNTLGMPHEFAIGFRFGHSQLRSKYQLNEHHHFRLFDSLSDGLEDLQGGKCLSPDRLINWSLFAGLDAHGHAKLPSNEIDRHVNEVVFDLPQSTIPDDIVLVSNLPFRNLVRSNSIGLCSGEDLATEYGSYYNASLAPANQILPLTPAQVDPEDGGRHHPLFHIEPGSPFRTPLWYYLLREAEVDRAGAPQRGGRLGKLGSYLVAEVLLSGIWYAPVSLFAGAPGHAEIDLIDGLNDVARIDLPEIAHYIGTKTSPPCEGDCC